MSNTRKETEDVRARPRGDGTEPFETICLIMRKYRAFIESLENRRAA